MPHRTAPRTEDPRTPILEHAVALGSTDGLSGLTIARVAAASGVSKSGLFGLFGSKEALQLATLAAAHGRFDHEVIAPSNALEPGIARLRALCRDWLSYVEREVFPGGCFLCAASLEFDDQVGPVRDAIALAMEQWMTLLATQAKVAQTHGELPSDRSARDTAFEIQALLMAGNWAYRLFRDPASISRTRRAVERLLGSAAPG